MSNFERLEDIYKFKQVAIPESLANLTGHFNVFGFEQNDESDDQSHPHIRRDFYKITLSEGAILVHYADKSYQIKKHALIFSNPLVPYSWEGIENIKNGVMCVFNQDFFRNFGILNDYTVFKPDGTHVFELTDEQAEQVRHIYLRMQSEISTDYQFKQDLLRMIVMELIHFAMKLQPTITSLKQNGNAAHRIYNLFIDLLERQFPIESVIHSIFLKSPSEYAKQLNVHVNHLNRSVKEMTGKSTYTIISERTLKESKILLKHSSLSISEIAFCLGYSEPTHFNNFFKKHTNMTPLQFRNI